MPPPALLDLITDRAGRDDPACLYGYDLAGITSHARRVVDSLPERCRMFYAMKANSAAPILAALAPVVAGFEVASAGEVRKVRGTAPGAAIIYGGPLKTRTAIATAIQAGAVRLHAESVTELTRISTVAARLGAEVEVLLRVNLAGPFPKATLAMAGRPTQFGIDESVLPEAVALARELPGIRLVGFHLHSLSNNLDAAAHLDVLDLYRTTVEGWEKQYDLSCEVLNVGGGIGVDVTDPDTLFDWDGFAAGLARLVEEFPAHWREIQFECGRYLVAPYGWYACEVMDVKRNHGEAYVLLRGGTHHFRLPSSWQHSHPFTVVPIERWDSPYPREELTDTPVTVTGELCSPKDVLARGAYVDRVRVGDVVVFELAGAYGWEISHHDFLSHPHPEQAFLP
ncbi:MAG: type III PLP-dependent enzyme [Micromonosporaceae bacterium]